MKAQIRQAISNLLEKEACDWLENVSARLYSPAQLYRAFAQIPRKTGKAVFHPFGAADDSPVAPGENFYINNWSADRLCRVYLLASYSHTDPEEYHKAIEALFVAADINELIALYSALPVLAHPESWEKRCAEGIRSNIGSVLEAVMYYNPYPATYLAQPAWNQMILKAFFTDKQFSLITGLQERNNQELALTLMDYVHERLAAGRTLNPVIWLLTGRFAEEAFMADFAAVISGTDEAAKKHLREGLALSGFPPVQEFLQPSDTDAIRT